MEKIDEPKKYKHLTKTERDFIEICIAKNEPIKQIAKKLRRGTSTVTNEILKNRFKIESLHHCGNDCTHSIECIKTNLCGDKNCPFPCKWCRKGSELGPCTSRCSEYHSNECTLLINPPYVCNICQQKDRCIKTKFFYNAKKAEFLSGYRKKRAHHRPRISDLKLYDINKLLNKLVKRKGQSLSHIMRTHSTEIGVSLSTLYNYIRRELFDIRIIDLRRAPGMKPRKKSKDNLELRRDRSYKKGRSYGDYSDYILENTDEMVCEMDTVEGKKKESKRILTILMKKYHILLIFLLPNGKAASVCNVFNYLNHKLGLDTFRELFPVILTDNGTEFQQVEGIELSVNNEFRTSVFYCDPNRSDQKGAIEKAHEFIRYVLPKGSSFEPYEQTDFTLLMNHINSYYRKSMEGKCPFDLVPDDDINMHKLMDLLHMNKIPPDEVNLTPSLLKKRN